MMQIRPDADSDPDKDGADLVPEHFRHVRLEFLLLLQRLKDVLEIHRNNYTEEN
jgi:hypothetical protein